ncbi:O-antigen ligase family protein [Deinococcus koreensis]|uniref:O-antigen ligase-related domain-containing protein n=1 Tax=Deinococcus koreensis TaxID=2054903 RepID=A0A2K3UWV6_9DEIO|nr:O-antigen ligase family protein [Deinococcus koreensis]PNY81014.1 hypothetical protein CVO96_06155 [Deinococcus koreensis]
MNPLLAFLILFPVAMLPIRSDGVVVFLYAKLLTLTAFVLLFVLRGQYRAISLRRSDLWIGVLVVLASVSDAVNGVPLLALGGRLEGPVTLVLLFAWYLMARASFESDPNLVVTFRQFWPAYVFIPLVIALLQYFSPASVLATLLSGDAADAQPGSTFGNRGSLASFLMVMIPIGLASIRGSAKPRDRRWLAVLLLLVGLVFAVAQTRAAWLGLGLAGLIGLIWFRPSLSKLKPLFWPAVILVAGFGIGLALPNPDRTRHFESPDSGRVLLWTIAVRAIESRPLLGWGTGGFKRAFDRYADWQNDPKVRAYLIPKIRDPRLSYTLEQDTAGIYVVTKGSLGPVDFFNKQQIVNDKAHNEYLDMAVQYGLVYPAAWLAWILIIIWRSRSRYLEVGVSVVALLIFNVFWMNSVTVLPIVMILVALLSARRDIRSTNPV